MQHHQRMQIRLCSVGDKVKKGQILAIVEAMKLMNEIESDFDGTVAEILCRERTASRIRSAAFPYPVPSDFQRIRKIIVSGV